MKELPQILIAEDDYEDRFIMSETFNELGYPSAIKMVEEGIKLIEYLSEAGHEAVKLIILDLNMPCLNGTDTLRLLRNNPEYKNIPVIIFSTSVNEIEKNICMSIGASEYITKPSKYSEYMTTCKKFYDIAHSNGLAISA